MEKFLKVKNNSHSINKSLFSLPKEDLCVASNEMMKVYYNKKPVIKRAFYFIHLLIAHLYQSLFQNSTTLF